MLKVRIIPILTFNGLGLVKTKQFLQPRMVGNPVQAARVFNSRGVDELIFLDIFASAQHRKLNLKLVSEVIRECYMPVGIGGGITTLQDIGDLLKIGADKVVIKSAALSNPAFIKEASGFFGAQCISVSVDVVKNAAGEYVIYTPSMEHTPVRMDDFLEEIQDAGAGEIVLTAVEREGMMDGFDLEMVQQAEKKCHVPMIVNGGGGNPSHYQELFTNTNCEAVSASSIFHFTQYTPLDVKRALQEIGKPVRL